MRVFVTGATGFIGSAVVQDLLAHGHEVAGLARSGTSAAALERAGAGVVRGTTEDLDVLKTAAAGAGGVIHTAYIHDFSPAASPIRFAEIDRDAIAALGEALAGTGKPLVVAAGWAGFPCGHCLPNQRASASSRPSLVVPCQAT
jgi:nucleoside-diphosphate-sugar epimerase